ncbi:hypothetical protein C0J52_26278 [Blattella germanica]|nr:hypothetical protein C0J52_27690 [Blattella germanica]PSN29223.1 hypothetical protein C0J52_26278 [Blattella germanica]
MAVLMWAVITSATIWTSFYFILKQKYNLEAEWCCRFLTAIHAIIVTFLAAISSYFLGPWPMTDPGGPNTELHCIILITSLGYFIFDMIWCLYHQTEGMTMLIHHAISILALGRILMKGVSGTEAVAGLLGLEITNPILQLRWFLRSAGYKGSILFTLVELAFMIMFFVMRIIGGSYLYYCTVSHSRPDIETKLLASAFYILSWKM